MDNWRDLVRSVVFEGVRVALAWFPERFSGSGKCGALKSEAASCLSALEACVGDRIKLLGLEQEVQFLNKTLSVCQGDLAGRQHQFSFWWLALPFFTLIVGLVLGYFVKIGEVPKQKVRRSKIVKSDPVPITLVTSFDKTEKQGKHGRESSDSVSSEVARARARARALRG